MSSARTAAEAPSRRRLVEAAKRLLWRAGYQAMSPRRLLGEAGLGQGSLYYHFPGKAALAAAALEETAAETLAAADAAIAAAPDAAAAIRALMRAADPLAGCRLGRLVNEEAFDDAALRAPVAAFFAGMEARLTELVARAQAEGTARAGPPEAHAAALLAALQGAFVLARAHRDPAAFHRAVAGALPLVLTSPQGDRP